jgi:hypothetical protein
MKKLGFSLGVALTVLTYPAAIAFAQADPPRGYTGAYAPAGTPPTPYSTGPLPQIDDGKPGWDVATPAGSTREVKPIPCSAAASETDGSTTCVGIEGDASWNKRH